MSAIIKCPKCGREYLPCEIYLPDSFLGKAKNILKENDKILTYMGKNMDLNEKFICDNCKTSFDIVAKVTFNTSISSVQITDKYVQKIKRPKVYSLSET